MANDTLDRILTADSDRQRASGELLDSILTGSYKPPKQGLIEQAGNALPGDRLGTRAVNTFPAIWKGIKMGVSPTQLGGHVARVLESGKPSEAVNVLDSLRENADREAAAFQQTREAKNPTLFGSQTVGDVVQNIAPQMPQMLEFVGGGALGALSGAAGGPVGTALGGIAGAASSLIPAYHESQTRTAQAVRQAEDQKRAGQGLLPMTMPERQALEQRIEPQTQKIAAAEVGTELPGMALEALPIFGPLAKLGTKPLANAFSKDALKVGGMAALKGAGATALTEPVEEAAATMMQQPIERELGLTQDPAYRMDSTDDWKKAFGEVTGPTLVGMIPQMLLGGGLGGVGAVRGGRALYARNEALFGHGEEAPAPAIQQGAGQVAQQLLAKQAGLPGGVGLDANGQPVEQPPIPPQPLTREEQQTLDFIQTHAEDPARLAGHFGMRVTPSENTDVADPLVAAPPPSPMSTGPIVPSMPGALASSQAPTDYKPSVKAEELMAHARSRLDEINAIANGTPDTEAVDPSTGKPIIVPGRQPQFLSAELKAERQILTDHINDPAQLAERFGLRLASPEENQGENETLVAAPPPSPMSNGPIVPSMPGALASSQAPTDLAPTESRLDPAQAAAELERQAQADAARQAREAEDLADWDAQMAQARAKAAEFDQRQESRTKATPPAKTIDDALPPHEVALREREDGVVKPKILARLQNQQDAEIDKIDHQTFVAHAGDRDYLRLTLTPEEKSQARRLVEKSLVAPDEAAKAQARQDLNAALRPAVQRALDGERPPVSKRPPKENTNAGNARGAVETDVQGAAGGIDPAASGKSGTAGAAGGLDGRPAGTGVAGAVEQPGVAGGLNANAAVAQSSLSEAPGNLSDIPTSSAATNSSHPWESLPAPERETLAAKAGWGTKKGAVNAFGKKLAQKPWGEIKPEHQARLQSALDGRQETPNENVLPPSDQPVQDSAGNAALDRPAPVGQDEGPAVLPAPGSVAGAVEGTGLVEQAVDSAAPRPAKVKEALRDQAKKAQDVAGGTPPDVAQPATARAGETETEAGTTAGQVPDVPAPADAQQQSPVADEIVRKYQERSANKRVITHDGKEWYVTGEGTEKDGKTFVHLSSTSEGRAQKNGWNPIQINDWVDNAVLDAAVTKAKANAQEPSAGPQWVEHTTGKGKTPRGIVRKDITVQEAKAIDPFTFRKDGGFFIREKYVQPDQFVDANKKVDKPIRETVTPAEDTQVGFNRDGERLMQRADGSRYRLRMDRPNQPEGYPDFGGDLAPVEAESDHFPDATKMLEGGSSVKESLTVAPASEASSAAGANSATTESTDTAPGAAPVTPEAGATTPEAQAETDPAEDLARQAQMAARSFNPSPGVKGTRAQMRENFIRQYAKDQPEAARAVAQAWQADPDKYAKASGATPDQIRMFARVVNEVVPAVDVKAETRQSADYVLAPDGTPRFGEITQEIGQAIRREAGEIRLAHGDKKGGLVHIEHRHGDEIRQAGFASAPDFVYGITSAFDEIRKGAAGALLLVKNTEGKLAHNVYVRLKPSNTGVFYVVETGFVRTSAAVEKSELLWPRREDRGADTGNQPSFADTPADTAGAEAASAKSQSFKRNLGQSAGESKPRKRRVSQKAKQADSAQAERIDDFGEKLEGARKDYASKLQAAMEVDVASEPLAKSWPEPDYQKMLDNGVDSWSVAFIRALRDEVPTKPQKRWKLSGWVKQVTDLREFAMEIGNSDEMGIARVKIMLGINPQLSKIAGRIELYQAVGHSKSLKGVTFEKHHYTLYRGEENVTKWSIQMPAKATAFSNWPRELAVANTKEEALNQFKENFASLDLGGNQRGKASFIIYRKRNQAGAFIGKKIGREYVDLHHEDDVASARAYLAGHQAALEERLKQYKATPYERNEENAPRVGGDHRNGAPVTPQVFGESFGFRGVQFGNYVEQDRRQSDLNEAYDGLMDMAAVLGIPAKAISLNGRLGLAFGARGKGGIGAAAAHYEPDTVVINLTKGGGPGSLAHEWWHALDNYFAKEGGGTGFMTADAKGDALRDEMRDAFLRIRKDIQSTAMRERSRQLDKRRSKDYWSTNEELSARAFESYIIAKLQDQNASNDYLANVVSQEDWDQSEGGRDFGEDDQQPSYPYPTVDELPTIRAAFDEFFRTVETRETDQGVALFSRAESGQAPEQTAFQPSADQTEAEKLNRAMVRAFQDPSWSNAYVRADLPDVLAEFAQAAEAAFGTRVVGIAATDARFDQFNGINVGGRNFINVNADVGFVHITGHELLHQLKRDRPDLYRWFVARARQHYQDFPAYQTKYRALQGKNEKPASLAAIEEELLGDFTGDALADPRFVERLAKADPSRFRQLLNTVIRWLKQVGDKLAGKGLGSSQYFKDVEALREHLANALVAYGQGGPVAIRKLEGPKFSSSKDGGTSDTQLQKEYEDTKARYEGTDQWMKATNGQPTKLNERQWVMVRTPRFKAWFGDWEVAAAKPERMASTFGQAKQFAKEFRGLPLKNLATGMVAQVSRNNLDKMLSGKAVGKSETEALHSLAVANLDNLFQRAQLGWSKPDRDGDPNIKFIHRFFAPIAMNGQAWMVKMTVKETGLTNDPNPLYTVEAVSFDAIKNPAAQWVAEMANADGVDPKTIRSAGLVKSMGQAVQNFKPGLVSKVIDENGEPLVVYHGADEKRTTFDARYGTYFAADKGRAKGYAEARTGWTGEGELTEAFLNIRNPQMFDADNDADFIAFTDQRDPSEAIAEKGYDGQILEFPGSLADNDYRVNSPEQVKSVDNTGAFSPDTSDIRFSRRRPPETKPPEASKPEPPPEFTGNPEDLFASIDGAITGGGGVKEHWAKAEGVFNELSSKTRRQVLGLMTVHQLVEQGSKVLPRMTDYLNEMTRMDATRGQIVHEADGIVKDWRQLDPATLNRLAFVMHESTIAGVDGAEAFMPSIDVKDTEKRIKALYGLQRGSGGDKRIPKWQQEIRELKAQIGFEAKRRDEYGRIKAMYDALPETARAIYARARDFHVDQSKRVEQALVDMIEKSDMTAPQRAKTITQLKKDFETQRVQAPYFPLARQGDYWVSVAAEINDDDVVTQPAEFHTFKTFEQQAAFFDERVAEGRQVAKGKKLENLKEVQGVSAGFVADTLDVIGQLGESNPAVEDIRDQIYQLYLKTLPELSSRKHAIHRKKTKGFGTDALRAFADKASHDAYAYARIKHGFNLRSVMEALGEDLQTAGSAHQQGQMTERKALLEEFRDDVLNAGMGYQAVKERAESMSLKAMEINATAQKRRKTEGERFVIEEADKWHQFHQWMQDWTRNGKGPNWVNQQLQDIEQRAETTRQIGAHERGSEYAYDVYNELQQAYKHMMNPSTGRFAVMLNSLGYLWHLAASPAAWITNALQTPTITMPYVSARFGVGPTTRAFTTAFRESLRDAAKRKTGKENRFGIREALTREDEIKAYTEALDRGLIERGRVMDLMGTAEEGASRSEAQRRWAMAMTFGFHDAERLNREVSFMASYRLAREAGQSFDDAVDYAGKVVNDTHFNYAAENRARFMRGDAARAITQFKSYGQHITYLQWRAVSEALGQDATPEQKKEARRFLLTQTAVQLAAAGVMGLPLNLWAGIAATKGGIEAAKRYGLMGALGYTALVMGAAVGLSGDDEDDPTDWEEELKQGLKEAFGDTGGEAISKGLFNALISIDLSSRLSQRELWWRDIDADIDDRQLPFEILSQIAGAGIGTFVQMLEGMRLVSDGHTERGIEKMLPKATKDVLQAARFASEGALTMKGDPLIEDFTPWEITAKAIGFTPSSLSQRYEENSANTTREKRIEDRRRELVGRVADARIEGNKAQKAGDTGGAEDARETAAAGMTAIKRFNQINPGLRITPKTIQRSVKSRNQARLMAQHGVFLNRKLDKQYDYAD